MLARQIFHVRRELIDGACYPLAAALKAIVETLRENNLKIDAEHLAASVAENLEE